METDFVRTITRNAEEVRELHDRIYSTLRYRHESPAKLEEWEQACRDFHGNYDRLAFPGGYTTNPKGTALSRLVAGDEYTMEAAICFLEIRPYFFRSGYMFKDILRKAKKAPLSEDQARRLQIVIENWKAWKQSKRQSR
jgi:hypothetical protein